jgi:uncharacterized repeat protein (TIGR03803 family)
LSIPSPAHSSLPVESVVGTNLNHSRKLAARRCARCFPVLFLLAGWLALVTPLRADNPPTYLFEIDASAVPGGFEPNQLAVDSSNNLYVTDILNNRVIKFSSNGRYLTQWGSVGGGRGQFNNPRGVAADTSNNIYVVDQNNNRVEKFDSNGDYLAQWGSSGSGNGQFNNSLGAAVDSGNNVYVADDNNNRVEKFDSNGHYLTQWGGRGTNNGQFEYPEGVAVDRSNNVYVADDNNFRVEKFSSNGTYLTQWGSISSGQFRNLHGIAMDSTGNSIYVTDYGDEAIGPRIEVFVNNANIVPPIITQQPTNQTVPADTNVTFSIGVVGTAPFNYQWSSNNVAVPGATNSAFKLPNVSLSDSATYSVLVTNSFGSETSSNALLTVLPAVAITQPASDISATGAVLNGLVTVGPDETVVWFEWGTDTNYGNVAGATTVPGNNGSTNISRPLSGLAGNIYHYRIDAANDFGIVFGDDQSFTVGFAPTAKTLATVNSTNGSTLNALVNPEGWDTVVYFQWGTPTLTNSTSGMDIGADATSLNVSTLVPGLAPLTPHDYQVVASNALGTVFGAVTYWSPPSVAGQVGMVFMTFHSFGRDDGANPYAGLVQGKDGYLYGTAEGGGTYGLGTVFKISTNGVLTVLHSFTGTNDGSSPFAGLVLGSDGNFYGTTFFGGPNDATYGTVFKISTNGVLNTVVSFSAIREGFGGLVEPLGANPFAGLVHGSDGSFYGTTENGGDYGYLDGLGKGTVFAVGTNGALTSLYSFNGGGANPDGGLMQGSDGSLYGTTTGGISGNGTVFKITTNGVLTTLYTFGGTNDGANPQAAVVQGSDGSLYGTTEHGGTTNYNVQMIRSGFGTVFKITTNGVLTTLYTFGGTNDGANPVASLVQGNDGNLYGTTSGGGSSGNGTVFAINTNGAGFTTLYSFSAGITNGSGVYNNDGANPQAGLILVGNTLYGTTSTGGTWGDGTVFSLTLPRPQLSIIASDLNMILAWPTKASGVVLQSTTNLVSMVWTTNSPAPVVINGQNVVTNLISGTQQFFRLSQ